MEEARKNRNCEHLKDKNNYAIISKEILDGISNEYSHKGKVMLRWLLILVSVTHKDKVVHLFIKSSKQKRACEI